MQVVTFDQAALDAAAACLAEMVADGGQSYFDAVVGVARGGSFVCDAFIKHIPSIRFGARFDISLQRPSTKNKGGKVGRLLRSLPLPVLDTMRMAESRLLSAMRILKSEKTNKDVKIPDELGEIIDKKTNPGILVIDDAIDSGETLLAIVESLKDRNPGAQIVTAVLTVTTSRPRIMPDYTLYNDKTLIRFPWSNDYKNR